MNDDALHDGDDVDAHVHVADADVNADVDVESANGGPDDDERGLFLVVQTFLTMISVIFSKYSYVSHKVFQCVKVVFVHEP